MADGKETLNAPLRLWLADRMDDFKQQLKDEDDPAVVFEVGGITCEVRLIHLPYEFTRFEYTPEPTNEPKEAKS